MSRNPVSHAGKKIYSRRNWKRVGRRSFPLLVIIASSDDVTKTQAATPPLYGVRMQHVWIPMKDGVRLAADLFMPLGARPGEKFPAIFKLDPYRKDDNEDIIEECDRTLRVEILIRQPDP